MKRAILLIAALFPAACMEPDLAPLTGVVSSVYPTPPSTLYPGEIRISGTSLGAIRVYVGSGVSIRVRTDEGYWRVSGFEAISAGDSVVAWYEIDGIVLTSNPPVYPVRRLELWR